MHYPIPSFPPLRAVEPQQAAQSTLLGDVQWNRPIFKAPPLEPLLTGLDLAAVVQDLRPVGLGAR